MSFGTGGFGSIPFGSGLLVSTFGVALNIGSAILVQYSGSGGGCGSILDPYTWTLVSDCDPCPPFVQLVTLKNGQLSFHFDRKPKCNCDYVLSNGEDELRFTGLCHEPNSGESEEDELFLVDIANPQFERDTLGGSVGTFQLSETGDYLNQGGEASLRKRVIRRCTFVSGEIFSSPEYGGGLSVKKLARPDLLLVAQAKMEAQIRQEPEVVDASVRLSRVAGYPQIIWISVSVRTPAGNKQIEPFKIGDNE